MSAGMGKTSMKWMWRDGGGLAHGTSFAWESRSVREMGMKTNGMDKAR